MHSEVSTLVQSYFEKHVEFEAAIDKAFRSLMNTSSELRVSGPESMARYFDFLLRKKHAVEESTRDKLEQLVSLALLTRRMVTVLSNMTLLAQHGMTRIYLLLSVLDT